MSLKDTLKKFTSPMVYLNLIALAIATILAMGGLWFWMNDFTRHGVEVEVPNVKGKLVADAEYELGLAQLTPVRTDSAYNRNLPPGTVLEQLPASGSHVKEGREIYLTINSTQTPTLMMPDIADNCSLREAEARLKALGFKLAPNEYIEGDKDWVLGVKCRGQNVAAGERVPIDAPVTLVGGNSELERQRLYGHHNRYGGRGMVMPQEEELILEDDELLEEVPGNEADEHEHWRIEVDKGQSIMRIDKLLMMHMGNTSRNRIQKAAEAGCIRANGKPVKSNYKAKPGDVITLVLDRPKRDWEITPEDIPLDITYEDDQLMVINKPAGMVVHPGCGNYSGTLVNAIAWHMKDCPEFDANDPTVGLVHRIDKDTSGLLVIAKTPEAKTSLCKQFFYHTTRRLYNALVWGPFAEDEGTIVGNIGRHPKDRLQMAVYPPESEIGKPAVTHYRVLERFGPTTLVECRLETGRTHQIRAHMRHLGHPLFADERYGGDQILRGEKTASYKAFIHNCMEICPRQALHARTLGFRHPLTGEEMDFSSPLPDDMTRLIEKWRKKV